MTANQPPDSRFDVELKEWMERQEPRRRADAVADAVIARVSITNQGRQPSFLLSLGTAAMAAVVAAMALSTGVLVERAAPGAFGGPSVTQAPTAGLRLPPGAQVIQVSDPISAPISTVVAHGDSVWVATSAFMSGAPGLWRIDPDTSSVTTHVANVVGAAFRGDELWAMVGDQQRQCCTVAPLRRLHPTTGAVLRTIEGVMGKGLAIAGDTAWTATETSLLQVDLRTGRLIETVELSAEPWHETLVVTEAAAWVITWDGLIRVDTSVSPSVATLVLPDEPSAIAAGGGYLWAALRSGDEVVQLDEATGAILSTIELGGGAETTRWGILTYAEGYVWASVAGGLKRIDPDTGSMGGLIPLPWGFYWGMQAVDGEMWVTVEDEAKLVRFPMPLN